MYKRPTFIALSGIIGVGKTTLADSLASRLKFDIHHELGPDTSRLDAFYGDKTKYAFSLQIHLLAKRFEQHQRIVYSDRNAIVDRSIYEDAVFARVLRDLGHMSSEEYDTYLDLSRVMHKGMCRPTVVEKRSTGTSLPSWTIKSS
jgi:deoxyadenosine kinase